MGKRFRNPAMQGAWDNGGYRERYAMENGNRSVLYMEGRELWRFTYSKYKPHQDANGATYDATHRRWVN